MTSDVTIEPASSEDVERIAQRWVDLAREQREFGSHVRPDANRETIVETFAAYRAGGGLLVARRGEEIVGFASFTMEHGTFELDADRGLLSNIYVRPADRNRGIGSRLLAAAEAALDERGADVVTLEAMARNEAARRFYRRHGYDVYRVAMERSLESPDESDTHSKE